MALCPPCESSISFCGCGWIFCLKYSPLLQMAGLFVVEQHMSGSSIYTGDRGMTGKGSRNQMDATGNPQEGTSLLAERLSEILQWIAGFTGSGCKYRSWVSLGICLQSTERAHRGSISYASQMERLLHRSFSVYYFPVGLRFVRRTLQYWRSGHSLADSSNFFRCDIIYFHRNWLGETGKEGQGQWYLSPKSTFWFFFVSWKSQWPHTASHLVLTPCWIFPCWILSTQLQCHSANENLVPLSWIKSCADLVLINATKFLSGLRKIHLLGLGASIID